MIIIDNNISHRIKKILRDDFEQVYHVSDFNLDHRDDLFIWEFAAEKSLHILTKDKDFAHIQNIKGHPPKIIQIMAGNISTPSLGNLLRRSIKEIRAFLSDGSKGMLLVYQ